MFVLAKKNCTGQVWFTPVEVAGEFSPTDSMLAVGGHVCGERFERVAPLVWVDVNNVDAAVAMILPLGISESVASAALSAAWREWRENADPMMVEGNTSII